MNKYTDIWTPSRCLSKTQLSAYIRGDMDRDEVYLVESHLNDCPLCSDALDALMNEPPEQVQEAVSEIKKAVEQKIRERFPAPQAKPTPARPVADGGAAKVISFWSAATRRWAAAAAILFGVALGGYSIYTYLQSPHGQLAQETAPVNELHPSTSTPPTVAQPQTPSTENTPGMVAPETNVPAAKNIVTFTAPVQTAPAESDVKREEVRQNSDLAKDEDMASRLEEAPAQVAPVTPEPRTETENAKIAPQVAKAETAQRQVSNEEKFVAKRSKADYGLSNSKPPSMLGNKNLSYPTNTNQQPVNMKETTTDEEAGDTPDEQSFEKGFAYYKAGDYRRCIPYLETALSQAAGEQQEDIRYYLAKAYTETGRKRKAEKMYALLSKGSKYKKEAEEASRRVSK